MDDIQDSAPILKALLAAVLAYVGLFSVLFLMDPLALAPQLDAKENLLWASRIASGSLPLEPFYRALLYPLILAQLGPESVRPIAGAIFGFVCHLANGALVWGLGRKVWKSGNPALLATILYLANPASLFFSLQLLDVTLSTTLFLSSLLVILKAENQITRYVAAGVLCGLAVLARPHFLPAALILPFAALLTTDRERWKAGIIYLPLLVLLLVQGYLSHRISGDFRILPWQGAYNLWAANKPESNGLYFKQSVDLALRGNDENPTRAESIYLYGQARPDEVPPYPIERMNTFWREQFINHVMENPLQVFRLWLYKGYAVVNSFEQYNNFSFPFHKERLQTLRFNPINWGILLILGVFGMIQLFRSRPRIANFLLLVILAYASVLVLFYASARFRLPLVPLMAVLAGGSIGWFRELRRERGRLLVTAGIIAATGILTYDSYSGIRNTNTFIQDRLLMANANADLGRDVKAARWAREVLWESPERKEAQRIYAISYFNLRLSEDERFEQFGDWLEQESWIRVKSTQDPALATILAFYYWHWGEREKAMGIWQQVRAANPENGRLADLALSVVESPSEVVGPEQTLILRLLREQPDDEE